MELRIRSQDKMKLRRVIDLGIFEEQEGYTIYCDDSIDNILGTYNSKERALEVLDEIQKKLMDFKVEFNDSGVTYKDVSVLVYEMPEV